MPTTKPNINTMSNMIAREMIACQDSVFPV